MAAGYTRFPQYSSIYTAKTPEKGATKTTKVTNNTIPGYGETLKWYNRFVLVPKLR